jgi:hypothetical protein
MRLIPENTLRFLMQRPGEIPPPGNDRWGKSVALTPAAPSYCVVNTGMLGDVPTPVALQFEFSLDNQTYSATVPAAFPGIVAVDIMKAVDVKAGGFSSEILLHAGDSMPFCTLLAMALTVNVSISGEGGTTLYVHAVAAPVQTIDCASVTDVPDSPWDDVFTARFPADTGGEFLALPASTAAKQIFIQNNAAVDLYIGFGSLIPSLGPPPVYNMILPGGIHAIYESQLGAFTGAVNAIFAAGGSATDYAVFTRGIS